MKIAFCLTFLLSAALAANIKITPTVDSKDIEIPESFDARTNWPECSKLISEIADCGACDTEWAVAVASAASDRRCIASGGSLQVPVSAANLMSCCTQCGGDMKKAWNYWAKNGIVTGGRYQSDLGCIPYTASMCDHFYQVRETECFNQFCIQPECTGTCATKSGLNYTNELTYGESRAETFETVEDIQREILQNGPVTASIEKFVDFPFYREGIYYHASGKSIGGHSLRLLGWGTENNEAYWIAANAWNEDWGEKGIIRIRRGVNECNIESGVYAAKPKL
ncbi:unnamed protein product [Psylliodes chrysocephalus]|uniref:Peptidase C1A papain C-terminal domain-containing protein n=1 Tax=Psylliodes chrysocephalus TaxID=3402493 RepID=A0A9P0GID6_9CUCU|nr:unnamed protein product [Psylliodes chrysocephala]